jgi:hypothetical protein
MSPVATADLKQKLAKFSNLPSIPQTILQIKEVSEDPKATAVDLANCILSDHQLTSRILRMANSAYYGDYAGRITTVTQGIVVMGFRAVHNIAVSMAMYGVVNDISKAGKFDMTAVWTRSLASGVIAKFLTHRLNKPQYLETAFIAGFLHDIGQVILASIFPDKYKQLDKFDPHNPEICESERVLLEVDRPLYEHHRLDLRPDEKSRDFLVDLVYLSDVLYRHVMNESAPEGDTLAELLAIVQPLADISESDLLELYEVCRAQVAEIAQDLEIDIEGQLLRREVSEEDFSAMHQELTQKEVQLAFLQNATGALREAKSDDEILQIVCEAIFRGMQMGRVFLFRRESGKKSYAGHIGFGVRSQDEVKALSFPTDSGLFGNLQRQRQPLLVVSDNQEVFGSVITKAEATKLQTDSLALLPIAVLDTVEYVIFAAPPDGAAPIGDESLRTMASLADQGAMALERLTLVKKLGRSGR